MILLALLFAITESLVSIPPAHWTAIAVNTPQNSTTVHVAFEVRSGASKVQAILMDRAEAERFNRAKSIRPLFQSGFVESDQFRVLVPDAGSYVLLLDNRLEAKLPASVHLRLEMSHANDVRVRTVSPERRRATIALSFLFLGAVIVFSAVKFLQTGKTQGLP